MKKLVLIAALVLSAGTASADDIWGADGSYKGWTSGNSIYGADGSYQGYVQQSTPPGEAPAPWGTTKDGN
jgi:hypothetical protein